MFPGLAIFERSEALLFLGVLVGFAALTRKTWLKGCRERLKRHWALPVAVLAFSVPALIASVLIFPEPWYLKACLLLWVASIAWLIGYRPPDERVDGTVVALAVVLVIVTVPSVWAHYAGSDGRVKRGRNVRTIAAIRGLGIEQETDILLARVGMVAYLGDNFHPVAPWQEKKPFAEIMAEHNVGLILIDRELLVDRHFTVGSDWSRFLADPEAAGFSIMAVSGLDRRLAVRADLFHGLNEGATSGTEAP